MTLLMFGILRLVQSPLRYLNLGYSLRIPPLCIFASVIVGRLRTVALSYESSGAGRCRALQLLYIILTYEAPAANLNYFFSSSSFSSVLLKPENVRGVSIDGGSPINDHFKNVHYHRNLGEAAELEIEFSLDAVLD